MPLNATQDQQIASAIVDLRRKRNLERITKRDLNRAMNVIASDFVKEFTNTGSTQNFSVYERRFNDIIRRGYLRVFQRFGKQIFNYLWEDRNTVNELPNQNLSLIADFSGEILNNLIQGMRRNTRRQFDTWAVNESVKISQARLQKTEEQLIDSVGRARNKLLASTGKQPTNSNIAREARKIFLKKQKSRVEAIAESEIQKAAETAKEFERENYRSIRNNSTSRDLGIEDSIVEPIWVTQADNLVRDGDGRGFNHLNADGQRRSNGVFIVSGERLKHPGDTTLGASIGNVARCRCSATTIIES